MVVASPKLLDVYIKDTRYFANSVKGDVGGGLSSFDACNAREVVEQGSGVLFSCCVGQDGKLGGSFGAG